jgi:hypothetical protein
LLYTLPDRLCGKDLYEPDKGLKFGDSASSENNPVFAGISGAEQLVVADGRVLSVSDSGQFVRVLSLDDGRETSNPLSTGANNVTSVSLRLVGPRLYVISQRAVCGYNLDHPEDSWPPLREARLTPNVRDAFIGKRHLVLLDQPSAERDAQAGDQPAAHFRLLAYGRYSPAGKSAESGKLDQARDITHPAGIDATWQPVEGGFYYRSLDRKVHYLRGAEDAN